MLVGHVMTGNKAAIIDLLYFFSRHFGDWQQNFKLKSNWHVANLKKKKHHTRKHFHIWFMYFFSGICDKDMATKTCCECDMYFMLFHLIVTRLSSLLFTESCKSKSRELYITCLEIPFFIQRDWSYQTLFPKYTLSLNELSNILHILGLTLNCINKLNP